MRVWRISIAEYANNAFSGEGGLLFAARWHAIGTRLAYTSSSLALAGMEFFVNWNQQSAHQPLLAISAQIPEGIKITELSVQQLPSDWRISPVTEATQRIGSDWVRSGESAVLSAPSVVIPQERNLLLNPAHRDFKRVRIGKPQPFSFDPRMWK